MDKVLALVVSSAVLMVLGISAALIFGGAIAGVDKSTDNIKQSNKCGYQVNQYCNGNADLEQLDNKCLDEVPSSCGGSGKVLKEMFASKLT